MFRRVDWSAVADFSKNCSPFISRVKPTKSRPVLPAPVDTAQHRSSTTVTAA
jgi:hypothetical protein